MGGRRERENAFFNSEDQIEKYSSEVQEQNGVASSQAAARAQKFSPRGPPVLPVKKSRSCEVACVCHRSFCDLGCGLAAKDLLSSGA